MQSKGKFLNSFVSGFNRWISSLRTSPRFGSFVRRYITVVTYTGRRSGRTFSAPVGFQQEGNTVTIGVAMPDAKTWWRNFLDEPRPISLELDDVERSGQATAERDEKGRVIVTVLLDEHVTADPNVP